MNLTTPTTAAQLAAKQGRDVHEVACELADACRAGLIGGREFNGKIVYYPKDYDMTKEQGPVYGVPLIDTLPLGTGGMLQQMPSQSNLHQCRKLNERVVAGYEVLMMLSVFGEGK